MRPRCGVPGDHTELALDILCDVIAVAVSGVSPWSSLGAMGAVIATSKLMLATASRASIAR